MKTPLGLDLKRFKFHVALITAGIIVQQLCAAVSLTITPSAISNTYTGPVTLLVTGLTNGEPVVVRKYLDANASAIVDEGDTLWQQFRLVDGKASVFLDGATAVTNLTLPGDLDLTPGQITATLNPFISGFEQLIVGNYLFVLSSPSGNFAPITNSFTVTNFPFAQSCSGSVTANGTNVPNAVVLIFQSAGKNLNPKGGTVADNSGHYAFSATPGDYMVVAFESNFVANVGAAPNFTLGSGASIVTNLSLVSADRTLSGRFVDANDSMLGLPGLLVPIQSKNGFLTVAFTDSNGNFTAGVTSNQWTVQPSDQAVAFHGYLRTQDKLQVSVTNGSLSGVSIALPKATALFYGSIKDALNQPMAGIALYSSDNNSYEQNAASDGNGNYFAGALTGSAPWQVQIGNDSAPANYIFSSPPFNFNGGTNLNNGQAVLANFTALQATNHIAGHVQQGNGNSIANVQVYASATINGAAFSAQTDTDGGGNYSLNVGPGSWNVSVSCGGGQDSLDTLLGFGTYQCPSSQSVTVNQNDGTANFIVEPCGGIQILNSNTLPDGQVGTYYSFQFFAESCSGNFNWSLSSGSLPPGVSLYSGGALNGSPQSSGLYNFSVQVTDGSGHSTNQSCSINVASAGAPIPLLSSPSLLSSGRFRLALGGDSNSFYTIEFSTNLVNWEPLVTTNALNGNLLYLDFPISGRMTFFRAIK